jgi:peptidoglycan hydrolase CwlO-like protein
MTRRGRLIRAYRLGLRQARVIMQKGLDETRASLERELASLRAEVRQLKAEHSRAEEIVRALESEREFDTRLH